jgi:hypothetical protein
MYQTMLAIDQTYVDICQPCLKCCLAATNQDDFGQPCIKLCLLSIKTINILPTMYKTLTVIDQTHVDFFQPHTKHCQSPNRHHSKKHIRYQTLPIINPTHVSTATDPQLSTHDTRSQLPATQFDHLPTTAFQSQHNMLSLDN